MFHVQICEGPIGNMSRPDLKSSLEQFVSYGCHINQTSDPIPPCPRQYITTYVLPFLRSEQLCIGLIFSVSLSLSLSLSLCPLDPLIEQSCIYSGTPWPDHQLLWIIAYKTTIILTLISAYPFINTSRGKLWLGLPSLYAVSWFGEVTCTWPLLPASIYKNELTIQSNSRPYLETIFGDL